jgi:hypothetical protein
MIVEGQKVAYAGEDPYMAVSDKGKVLAVSGTAAHVQWLTGSRAGQIDLVEQHELVPDRSAGAQPTTLAAAFDNTLDMVGSPAIQVRATYDEVGEQGLVTALDEAGHLAVLQAYVEEAVGHLASRIRHDPTLANVLAQLESDEADGLVGRVASLLLTDEIGGAA